MCCYPEVRLVFHCSQWSREWSSSSWKTHLSNLVKDAILYRLSRLHYHWLQLESRHYFRCRHKTIQLTLMPAATSTTCLRWPASSLMRHTDSFWLHHQQDATTLSWICKCSCQQITSCRYSTRLNNATLMSYSCVNHLYTHEWLPTRPQTYRHQKQKAYFKNYAYFSTE